MPSRYFFVLSVGVVLLPVSSVQAQTAPDAGSLLKDLQTERRQQEPSRPAAAPLSPVLPPVLRVESAARVKVDAFRILGNKSIPSAELLPLLSAYQARELSVTDLSGAAQVITQHYRERGFILSFAYLPQQKIISGTLEIVVVEGRVGAVQIVAAQDVRLDDGVVQSHIGTLSTEDVARQDDIERRLLLLNDLPGIVARGTFSPGAEPGTSDLVLTVVEDEPFAAAIEANNHGSKSIGENRLGASFHLRDAFGWGESTRLHLLGTTGGRMDNLSLSTRVPVGGDGWAMNFAFSRLYYELGEPFASLGARGDATSYRLGASYTALRQMTQNLVFTVDGERKRLIDHIPLLAEDKAKTVDVLSFGASWESVDVAGATRLSVGNRSGSLRRDSASDPLRQGGHFSKWTADLMRDQSLFAGHRLYFKGSAQSVSDNLDSSEKLSLGGPYAVRAFGPDELSVDKGWLASLEYRYMYRLPGTTLQFKVFHDEAQGNIDRQPLAGVAGNDVRLSGNGVGASWSAEDDWDIALTWAKRDRRKPASTGDDSRTYVALSYRF